MQVWSRRASCAAHQAHDLATGNMIALVHEQFVEVSILGTENAGTVGDVTVLIDDFRIVINDDDLTQMFILVGEGDDAIGRGPDLQTGASSDIDSTVLGNAASKGVGSRTKVGGLPGLLTIHRPHGGQEAQVGFVVAEGVLEGGEARPLV